jgi:hypothetical protein
MSAKKQRPETDKIDWLTQQSQEPLDYSDIIDRIKSKILQLYPTSKVEIYKYARQVTSKAHNAVNAWGGAAVSARSIVLREYLLI